MEEKSGAQEIPSAKGIYSGGFRDLVIRFILFMALWLILSGHYDVEHISLGFLSVVAVLAVNGPVRRCPVEVDMDEDRWEFAPTLVHWGHLLLYIPWLIKEIVMASLQVAQLVLSPKMPVDPVLVGFRVDLRSPLARTMLGNSITLTPGTLTLEIQEDWFLVHALVESSAGSLISGTMQKRVAEVYGYEKGMVGEAKIFRTMKELGG
ncbi:MAG: Na+/H+ antiporter subunit E [Candidatus Eisenbacteria bacterium]|uniref:Na+/H+ antiporter subunit E n=1 Tax=Eiseniibacteriota bacterium TaxID=2212470 RepID=A0A948W5V1_UNCEI|nr:Na+/H+ antiporter subunit E [Candidatus Eisenbacteria bacterium]MBU1947473.1 Na+/H+ antiporter subunit E [Candidatus Eisenbacteria bacterium]MBU2690834.1 Na+/H+ antiporter subunit E [Candidatus Eisenbacteria bacterium]